MNSQRQFALGLLFLVALAVLGYYTLFLTDLQLFKERYDKRVFFPVAGGLRKGDAVLVAGLRSGKVLGLSFDPNAPDDRRVTVAIGLDEDVQFMRDYSIGIEDATVLGGTIVAIEPGTQQAGPHPAGEPLMGIVAGSPLESLNEVASVVTDNRDSIDAFIANLESASEDISSITSRIEAGEGLIGRLVADDGLADQASTLIDSGAKTFENLDAITTGVVDGKGVVGKLFSDEDLSGQFSRLADNIEEISTDLAELSQGVTEGKGTIGKLLVEETLYEDASAAVESFRSVARKIDEGEGVLGQLVGDGELRDKVDLIVTRLADGEGTLGKLLTDDQLHEDVAATVASIREVADKVAAGEGTLGKLLSEDELYVELQRALRTVNRSLEEFREVAPITAFSNVLFGVF